MWLRSRTSIMGDPAGRPRRCGAAPRARVILPAVHVAAELLLDFIASAARDPAGGPPGCGAGPRSPVILPAVHVAAELLLDFIASNIASAAGDLAGGPRACGAATRPRVIPCRCHFFSNPTECHGPGRDVRFGALRRKSRFRGSSRIVDRRPAGTLTPCFSKRGIPEPGLDRR